MRDDRCKNVVGREGEAEWAVSCIEVGDRKDRIGIDG